MALVLTEYRKPAGAFFGTKKIKCAFYGPLKVWCSASIKRNTVPFTSAMMNIPGHGTVLDHLADLDVSILFDLDGLLPSEVKYSFIQAPPSVTMTDQGKFVGTNSTHGHGFKTYPMQIRCISLDGSVIGLSEIVYPKIIARAVEWGFNVRDTVGSTPNNVGYPAIAILWINDVDGTDLYQGYDVISSNGSWSGNIGSNVASNRDSQWISDQGRAAELIIEFRGTTGVQARLVTVAEVSIMASPTTIYADNAPSVLEVYYKSHGNWFSYGRATNMMAAAANQTRPMPYVS